MKKILLIIFMLFIVPAFIFASEERILQPYEVMISADAGEDFGEVSVKIITDKNKEILKITGISLKVDDKWKDVAESALSGLTNPRLTETQIRTEAGYDEHPWLYIRFELAYRDESTRWNPKKVSIAYHAGKFEYLSISTPSADGSIKWEKKEL